MFCTVNITGFYEKLTLAVLRKLYKVSSIKQVSPKLLQYLTFLNLIPSRLYSFFRVRYKVVNQEVGEVAGCGLLSKRYFSAGGLIFGYVAKIKIVAML